MSNANGRIFIDNSTTPIKGVEIADLQQVLGIGSPYLGYIIMNGNINKWAKYKPFPSSDYYSLDQTQSTPALRSPDRAAAQALANFALDVVNADGSSLDYSSIGGAFKQIWTYIRPTPGTHKFRLPDFDGYHAVEVLPVQSLGDITVYRALVSGYNFNPAVNNNEEDVRLIDLTANVFDDWYVGVAFAKNAAFTGTLIYKTASTAIPSSGAPAFPTLSSEELTTLKNGGYTHYFMFVTDEAKTSFDGSVEALFRSLPRNNTSEMTGRFTISNRMVQSLYLTAAAFTRTVPGTSFYADMTNYTGNSQSFYNISDYYLHIAVSITALPDLATVLTKSQLSASLDRTFACPDGNFSGGTLSGLVISSMKDSNFTEQSVISIPAGTTQTVYLTIDSSDALAIDSNGQHITGFSNDQELNIFIDLFQRGADFASFNIRLSNH